MSDKVFPMDLAGIGIALKRSIDHDVQIQTAISGKEYRVSWAWEPRYTYDLTVDVARLTEGDVAALADFISSHFGPLDSFLIRDPIDCAVAAHGFGLGDGVTEAYQLQRSMLGSYYTALGGPYTRRSVPRTNYCLYSADLGQADWTITTATASAAYCPDGTINPYAKISASSDNTTISQTLTGVPTGNQILSVWLRGTAPVLRLGLHTTTGSPIALTSTWTRYSLAITDGIAASVVTIGAGESLDDGQVVEIWGAQVETGTEATEYIATTDAIAGDCIIYWPNYQCGFEPIYDPIVTGIYVDGVLQTADVEVQPYGVVVFDTAPEDGEVLTWSGTYHRRCRLADSRQTSAQIVQGLWEYGSIKLITVVP